MNNFSYRTLLSFKPNEVEVIDVIPLEKKTRNLQYQNRMKKILFNLVREGLKRLILKIKAYKLHSFLLGKEIFIICRIKDKNIFLGGYQHSLNQPIYYFLSKVYWDHKPDFEEYESFLTINPFLGFVPDQIIKKESLNLGEQHLFQPIILKDSGKNKKKKNDIDLYLIGCGAYTLTEILPTYKNFNRIAAVDFNNEILKSGYYKDFSLRTNDFNMIFQADDNKNKKLGIISSFHSYHTKQAIDFLKLSNSKVIIEKPPCVTREDLKLLADNFDSNRIFIAYHRRFNKWNNMLQTIIKRNSSPVIINMMIHEISLTSQHWYQAENQGTRITGNLCHWIDLAIYWVPKRPVSLAITKNEKLGIDYSIFSILFEDGSIVNLIPNDWGDGTYGVQEYIDIKSQHLDIRVNDYVNMKIWERGRTKKYYSLKRSKGHVKMNQFFKDAIINNLPSSYTKKDLIYSTLIYISFIELFHSNTNLCELDFLEFIDI